MSTVPLMIWLQIQPFTPLFGSVLFITVLYITVLYITVLYNTVLCCAVQGGCDEGHHPLLIQIHS